MSLSAPRLHAPVLALGQYDLVAPQLATIATMRLRMGLAAAPAPITTSVSIPLTTVSLQTNFDAMIHITYPWKQGAAVELMVDSGNASLIVPSFDDIAHLPNAAHAYRVLARGVTEPWGCPANIVQGPIQIPMKDGGVYTIKDCVFYACTGPNPNGAKATANFGTGWVSPWPSNGAITLQSPLSYDKTFPYAEFRYAPAAQMLSVAATPDVNQSSQLTLTKTMPSGYRTFDIKRDCQWMSLTPKSLKIGNQLTGWPGQRDSIAMIDTGGGPVFLSDPDNFIFSRTWPDATGNPAWAGPPDSVSCQSTFDQITIEVGDDHASYSYTIDTSHLPAPVQGLTLVMCEKCYYMMENDGMNVGGISALFNDIVVDYKAGKIGLRPKGPAVV
jgi:hypothetical protein